MSSDPNNTSPEQEKAPEQTPTVDPKDLAMKPGYIADRDAQETVNNPAVAPQMLNDPSDDRGDLRRD
ncbi:hypothetical protein [Coleofasciculus sp.]|uniref:hypothetical protein n=1 Tax=Coleofasciculus sp. TaxID=3100458 RepID=UPI0039FA1905